MVSARYSAKIHVKCVAVWIIFPLCASGSRLVARIFFSPALPGEYETLSVNYWNFDAIELITAEIPWKQENNQTRQTQPKQHKHQTPAPPPGKFAKQGETRWDTTRPSQPLIGSLPPCSNPPRRPLFRCQPYLHLHLHPQAGLESQASVDVAWVDKCPLESATFLHNAP